MNPHLAGYLGPVNFLKLGTPFLLLWLGVRRVDLPKRTSYVLAASLAVLFFATLLSGLRCHFPSPLMRETASITLGLIAAGSFLLLGPRQKIWTFWIWGIVIYGSAFLDKLSPSTMDWFFLNVSDPNTLGSDFSELGQRALTGVFGRQSMAKILAWTPFIFLAFSSQTSEALKKNSQRLLFILGTISTGLILTTSQRGPFLGAIVGWCIFGLHQLIQGKNRRLALMAASAIGASLVVTAILVPHSILMPRIQSMFVGESDNPYTQTAIENQGSRLRMWKLSFDVVEHNPLGDSCIPLERFSSMRLNPFHAHNIFLQQFRERGWLWGFVHMALWILALVGAWRSRDAKSSFLVAGLATILVLGMVDHPWFVLNQAMMIGILLIAGLKKYFDRSSDVQGPVES
jgi:hypothetical protein